RLRPPIGESFDTFGENGVRRRLAAAAAAGHGAQFGGSSKLLMAASLTESRSIAKLVRPSLHPLCLLSCDELSLCPTSATKCTVLLALRYLLVPTEPAL